jgi:hypothetical protein
MERVAVASHSFALLIFLCQLSPVVAFYTVHTLGCFSFGQFLAFRHSCLPFQINESSL